MMKYVTSTVLLTALALSPAIALAETQAPESPVRDPKAVELLELSRAALLTVSSVSFRFVNGHGEAPFGWVEGHVTMARDPRKSAEQDGNRGRIRVDGTFRPQPAFDRPGFDFRFTRDFRSAAEWRSDQDKMVVASLEADPNTAGNLATNGSFGFLPEFIEAEPLWKELDLAVGLEVAGTKEVGGVLCDVVSTTLKGAYGIVHQDWYLARTDRLPRGLLWWAEQGGRRMEMPYTIHDLKTDLALEDSTFSPEAPEGALVVASEAEGVRLGEKAPAWSLKDADGRSVRSADLQGHVVVLDFWNTTCYLCHNALPQLSELATELQSREPAPLVTFLALNIWEQGDPAAYWKKYGWAHRMVPGADEVASAFGITGQPAVVVLDPDGKVLHAQVGFTADRAERVRRVIEAALKRRSKEPG